MRYEMIVSFIMDDEVAARDLASKMYTMCLQPKLWSLGAEFVRVDGPEFVGNGYGKTTKLPILGTVDFETLPYSRAIDPVQLPSVVRLSCSDPQGGFSNLMAFSAVDGQKAYYRTPRFQIEIPLNDGVKP